MSRWGSTFGPCPNRVRKGPNGSTEVYKLQAFRVRTHSDRVRTSMIKTTSCFSNSSKNLHVLHVPVGFVQRSDPVRTGSERVRTGPNVFTEVYKLQAIRVRTHFDRVRTSMTNTTSCFCNFYKSLAFYQSHCGSLHVRTLSEQVRMGPPRYINGGLGQSNSVLSEDSCTL